MLLVITYDVDTTSAKGAKRLRKVAKLCERNGIRVQNSVFEVLADSAQFVVLKTELSEIIDQELICKGWFLPPNTYDCGSFVVNGTAVVGKEKKSPYNRWKSTQKGANFYEISI